ncbi:hypothetical protein QFZ63_002272 [Streptomyces sp. B3I7]|uniref:hypothetical protein n=1 Tax=Streptomyces sp. B3I7 TaxID=3042269 RepID=UPI0027814A4D|nr:hypothetical protein [Streptomyces sp. B3I7]MDQ0810558.1 hypothetical protein [Streptomyces sp. B3I7]
MNDRATPAMHALPDGEAEIALVLHLPWEDVARLGQEAGRLAAQMQRPVTLDEAVSHRLRSTRVAAHARSTAVASAAPSASSASASSGSVSSLPPRPPAEPVRAGAERVNGSGESA